MEINKTTVIDIYNRAVYGSHLYVEAVDIDIAQTQGHITKEEADLLREAYGLQIKKAAHSYDGWNEMKLWEFMQAVGEIRHARIFDQEEVVLANDIFMYKMIKLDAGAFNDAAPALKNNPDFIDRAILNNPHVLDHIDINTSPYKMGQDDALVILKKHRDLYFRIPLAFRQDPVFLQKMVEQDPYMLSYLDRTPFADNKAIVMAAVRNYGSSLQWASPALKKDREIVLAAVQSASGAFEHADASLKSDRNFVLQVVSVSGLDIKYADEKFRSDPVLVFTAVSSCGEMIDNVDARFKKDIAYCFAAVTSSGSAYRFIDASVRANRVIALAALERDTGIFDVLHPSLKNDPAFIAEAFDRNFHIVEKMKDPPAALKARYDALVADLKSLGITEVQRFKTGAALEIIKNRRTDPSDNRPTALLVYPKFDNNRAFDRNQIDELVRRGFRVVYYEANEDVNLFNAIKETGDARPVSLLVIAGHGEAFSTQFGTADTDAARLDPSDAPRMSALTRYMARDSVILLESCSTGSGGSGYMNIATMTKNAFPQSKVIAPTVPVSVDHYVYDCDTNGDVCVTDIVYTLNREKKYSVK